MHKPLQFFQFYHWCLYYPSKMTSILATCSDFFRGWTGLSTLAVNHHIKMTEATVQGHLSQCLQELSSTKESLLNPPQPKHPLKSVLIWYRLPLKNNLTHYTVTKLANFPTLQVWSMPTLLFPLWMMQRQSLLNSLKSESFRNHHSLVQMVQISHLTRFQTMATHAWQWNTTNHQRNHQASTNHNPIHTTWHAQTTCSEMGNPNMEELFGCTHCRHPKFFFPQVVPPHQAMQLHAQHATTQPAKPKPLCLKPSGVLTLSMPHPWHHQAPSVMSTVQTSYLPRGDTTQPMHGTLAPNLTTSSVMKCFLMKPKFSNIRYCHIWLQCHLPCPSFQCWLNT